VWEEKHKEMIVASDPQTTKKTKKKIDKIRKEKRKHVAPLSAAAAQRCGVRWSLTGASLNLTAMGG
jgi:hypothetical protein